MVDLDPKVTQAVIYWASPFAIKDTVADFFEQSVAFNIFNKGPEEFVHASPFEGLFVMPSSPELDFLERKLETRHKIYKLREALKNWVRSLIVFTQILPRH